MPLLRQLRMLADGALGNTIEPMQAFVFKSRVWPGDMNLGGHMDNVRYLKLMDMTRTGFFIRSGIARAAAPKRISPVPVVAAKHIRYRRPLTAWQPFSLTTRILCWDDKWLFLEQTIHSRGRLVSEALVKCVFLLDDKAEAPGRVLALTGQAPGSSPAMPARVIRWLAMDPPGKDRQQNQHGNHAA